MAGVSDGRASGIGWMAGGQTLGDGSGPPHGEAWTAAGRCTQEGPQKTTHVHFLLFFGMIIFRKNISQQNVTEKKKKKLYRLRLLIQERS